MKIVILGLSITSSWGNGHATTFRGLVRELTKRGPEVLFLERDVPWYAQHRDLPEPPYGRTVLYGSLTELKEKFSDEVREADCIIVRILRAGRHRNRALGDGNRRRPNEFL